MAAENLLDIDTGADESDEFTVEAGTPAKISLKAAGTEIPAGAIVDILAKDDAGGFVRQSGLRSGARSRSVVIVGPGTYKAVRAAHSSAVGVFRD